MFFTSLKLKGKIAGMELTRYPQSYTKLLHWFKLISLTGVAQIVVQLTGLLSGILAVRLLSVQQYGWFTIANSMLAALTVLSDGGISSGVMAEAGKNWRDKWSVGVAMVTGFELRRKMAILSSIITIPILSYLLAKNGANWYHIVFIVITLVPAFYAAISDAILEIPLKLHQDIKRLQVNQLLTAVLRLLFTVGLLFVFPFAFLAVLAYGIPRMIANLRLKKIATTYAETTNAKHDPVVRKNIFAIVKRTFPGAVYYVFLGQISVWLMSIFGSNGSVAKIGALGRIAVLFTVLSAVGNTLVVPRFARLQSDRINLKIKFFQVQGAALLICAGLFFLIRLFATQLLWILGDQYAGLEPELILNILACLLSLVGGLTYGMLMSRGWAIHPILAIAVSLSGIIFSIIYFDISTLSGVLKLSIFQNIVSYLLFSIFGLYKISKLH